MNTRRSVSRQLCVADISVPDAGPEVPALRLAKELFSDLGDGCAVTTAALDRGRLTVSLLLPELAPWDLPPSEQRYPADEVLFYLRMALRGRRAAPIGIRALREATALDVLQRVLTRKPGGS